MKVLCPRHQDENPSLHVYEDSAYCFVCGAVVSLDEIGVKNVPKREKEDIPRAIERIKQYPLRQIRGLEFHVDGEGYYILWPGDVFYKKRLFGGSSRYLAPVGHSAPLFKIQGSDEKSLVLVEGEINAISLNLAYPKTRATIASFGSANNYHTYYNTILTYDKICVIMDKDAAGVVNGVNLRNLLLNDGKKVQLVCLPQDFNDILVKSGIEAIKEKIKEENVEML